MHASQVTYQQEVKNGKEETEPSKECLYTVEYRIFFLLNIFTTGSVKYPDCPINTSLKKNQHFIKKTNKQNRFSVFFGSRIVHL